MSDTKMLDGKDLHTVELKNGMVIQLARKEPVGRRSIHNMVVIDYGNRMIAIEQLMAGDKPTFGTLGDSYCFINRTAYPDTLGIEPAFGDEVIEIYSNLGIVEEVTEVVDTDEFGRKCKRTF